MRRDCHHISGQTTSHANSPPRAYLIAIFTSTPTSTTGSIMGLDPGGGLLGPAVGTEPPSITPAAAPPRRSPPPLRLCMADCTADLLSVVVSYLGLHDRAAFATVCSFHLLVVRMVAERGAIRGMVRQVNDPTAATVSTTPRQPPAFGLGYVDRPRFLQPGERRETVALVSYPRSGNSMLRGLLERMTGVVTGSDTRPDRVLSRSLLRKGLRGEGVVDDRAWVVKTHWPERCGYRRFPAQRAILLVRNPFDAINSYFNMALTNTHEQTLTDEAFFSSLAPLWDEMLRHEVRVWARFNTHWLHAGLPILAVRYEDLLLHPQEMLVRLLSFLEQIPVDAVRASPTYMARVEAAAAAVGKGPPKQPPPPAAAAAAAAAAAEAAAATGAADTGAASPAAGAQVGGRASDPLHANRPRGGGKIGGSMRYYSAAQVQAMCELEGPALRSFGYDPLTQNFPQTTLSLPAYERCVKFLEKSAAPPPSPAGVVAAAASCNTPPEPEFLVVNHGQQLRAASDKWGRDITKVRHSLTQADRQPLPTVQK